MYRIDNATSANAPVPPPTPIGKAEGYFSGGNPATATPATIVDAEWLNMIQEEGANLVLSAGLTLNKADRTQWSKAVDAKVAGLNLPFVLKAGDIMTGMLNATAGVSFNATNDFIATQTGVGRAIQFTPAWTLIHNATNDLVWNGAAAGPTIFRSDGSFGVPVNIAAGGSIGAVMDVTAGNDITSGNRLSSASDAYIGGGVYIGGAPDYRIIRDLTGSNEVRRIEFSTEDNAIQWIANVNIIYFLLAGPNTGAQVFEFHPTSVPANIGGTAWVAIGSDERIKQDIVPYDKGLAEVRQLLPKTYRYIAETGWDTTKRYVGLIAQDIQNVMPETIITRSPDEPKIGTVDLPDLLTYDPTALQYALINAVKELDARLTAAGF